MGFWGKAIGAGMGFMVGGPLGAIAGGFIGHAFDVESENEMRRYTPNEDASWPEVENEFDRQYLFYVSLASLAAKMAKADGLVTRDEIKAFDDFLSFDLGLSVEERRTIAKIFNQAKDSPEDAAAIARQFAQLIGFKPDVLQMMMELLFKIALADGTVHKNEETYLQQIAAVFGFSPVEYGQIRALYIQENDRAYQILGVSRTASESEIKKAYHKLVKENHPDKLQARGVPEDFLKIAQEKMAEINQAYADICKERGF